MPPGGDPLADADLPAVLADVCYVDGVTGGNVLVIGVEGARRLAAAMMGGDPDGGRGRRRALDELELSAVGEAMNQMMTAAAKATSAVLGEEVEIAPPSVRRADSLDDAAAGAWDTPATPARSPSRSAARPACSCSSCRNAFIVRMTRA